MCNKSCSILVYLIFIRLNVVTCSLPRSCKVHPMIISGRKFARVRALEMTKDTHLCIFLQNVYNCKEKQIIEFQYISIFS